MTPRYLVICNPETPRGRAYVADLEALWAGRGVTPEVIVVPWADIVPADGNLDHLPAFDTPAVVKIESPGKSDDVYRQLLDAGSRETPGEPRRDWSDLELPPGLMVRPGLHFAGFRRVLRGLAASLAKRPHLTATADPNAVTPFARKTAAAAVLRAKGVTVPEEVPPPLFRTEAPFRSPTYVKLNAGSSATGIAVVLPEREELRIETTVLRKDDDFFNSRQLLKASGDDAYHVLRWLGTEGAIAQHEVPAARIDGRKFDVRVVCYYGKPVAAMFRLSDGPITNLHLAGHRGGRRGDFAACRAHVPTRAWLDGLDCASDAAEAFDSAVCGVDLIFEPGYRRHVVLEVNAFGDFFPGLTTFDGRPLRHAEIAATARRIGFL